MRHAAHLDFEVTGRREEERDAETELVHYGVADAVATLTLDSQHNRNALSRQLVSELFDGLRPPRTTTTSRSC